MRHEPPGAARASAARAATFVAAREQAEQLFLAARAVGPAARPLAAFYGLSQAGRAVASAAHSLPDDGFKLMGHGITCPGLRQGTDTLVQLADITVGDEGSRRGAGAFERIATVLESGSLPQPVRLGDLWGLLPDLQTPPLPGAASLRAIRAEWGTNRGGHPERCPFRTGGRQRARKRAFRTVHHPAGMGRERQDARPAQRLRARRRGQLPHPSVAQAHSGARGTIRRGRRPSLDGYGDDAFPGWAPRASRCTPSWCGGRCCTACPCSPATSLSAGRPGSPSIAALMRSQSRSSSTGPRDGTNPGPPSDHPSLKAVPVDGFGWLDPYVSLIPFPIPRRCLGGAVPGGGV